MHDLLRRFDGVYAFQLFQEHESESRRWKHTPPSWNPAFEKNGHSFLSQSIGDYLAWNLLISWLYIIDTQTYRVGGCLNPGLHDVNGRTCGDRYCTTQRRR
jgi:hypothetical protein